METIHANKTAYTMFGKLKGSNTDKWNRATKLVNQFDVLDKRLRGICERGFDVGSENMRLATALLLMMHTGIRVGNEGSAEGYITKPHPNSTKEPEFVQTYGLTTLLREHLTIIDSECFNLQFLGKKCVDNSFLVYDTDLVRYLNRIKQNSYPTLFEITDYKLTKFIKTHVGEQFTPKDFRCMKANMYAWEYYMDCFPPEITTKKDFRTAVKGLFTHVSNKLNNTPAVCRKNYVCDRLVLHLQNTYEMN